MVAEGAAERLPTCCRPWKARVDFGKAAEPEVVPPFTRLMAWYCHKEADSTVHEIKDKLVELESNYLPAGYSANDQE